MCHLLAVGAEIFLPRFPFFYDFFLTSRCQPSSASDCGQRKTRDGQKKRAEAPKKWTANSTGGGGAFQRPRRLRRRRRRRRRRRCLYRQQLSSSGRDRWSSGSSGRHDTTLEGKTPPKKTVKLGKNPVTPAYFGQRRGEKLGVPKLGTAKPGKQQRWEREKKEQSKHAQCGIELRQVLLPQKKKTR